MNRFIMIMLGVLFCITGVIAQELKFIPIEYPYFSYYNDSLKRLPDGTMSLWGRIQLKNEEAIAKLVGNDPKKIKQFDFALVRYIFDCIADRHALSSMTAFGNRKEISSINNEDDLSFLDTVPGTHLEDWQNYACKDSSG